MGILSSPHDVRESGYGEGGGVVKPSHEVRGLGNFETEDLEE
jgi:hypothetical protein